MGSAKEDLSNLTAFIAVARERSFTRAPLSSSVAKDMIAVPIGPELRMAVAVRPSILRAITRQRSDDARDRARAAVAAARPFVSKRPSAPAKTRAAFFFSLPVVPNVAIRKGPELIIVRRDSAANEYHSAAALIETWHRGGIELNVRRQRIRASDVAILYP